MALEAGVLPDGFVPRKCCRAWFCMDGGDKRLIPMKLQVSSKFHAKPTSGTLPRHESAFQLCFLDLVKGFGVTLPQSDSLIPFFKANKLLIPNRPLQIPCKTSLRDTFAARKCLSALFPRLG